MVKHLAWYGVPALALLLLGVSVWQSGGMANVRQSLSEPRVTIGEASFVVSVADTEEARHQGLSNTPSLPAGTGKLFVFEQSARYSFWMKDMNYPIDIIWLAGDKRVVHIEENVAPDTYPEQSFKPASVARYVLEVNAGVSSQEGIKVGDIAIFENIGQ